ncbi:MAG: hypothetical protein JXA30_18520 [Deltaproteobacteria bacterium]|nr:hypothetical protein [Deltaproteobacteria bacterium]
MIKSDLFFISLISMALFASCVVDPTVPSTPAPNSTSASGIEKSSDAATVSKPSTELEAGASGSSNTGGSSAENSSRPNDGESRSTTVSDSEVVDAETKDAEVEDVQETQSPEDFGLSCDDVLCPLVTLPARQCCTQETDVEKRRARSSERCGIARIAVEGCTELEQLGALDDSCPSFKPYGSQVEEPGCCTEQGRCGSFDVAYGIGCHENETIDQACGQEEEGETQVCEPTGIYAVKAEVDLAWGGQSGPAFEITDDGRGVATIVLKITIDSVKADNTFKSRVDPCGVELPPISNSLICEAYLPTFPDKIWDGETVPPVSVPGLFSCLHPGCVLSIGPGSASIGIQLEDEGSPWPTADEATGVQCPEGEGQDCYPDHDGDGKPGITVVMPQGQAPASTSCRSGYRLRASPLSADLTIIINGVYRTDRLHLGVRLRLGASGLLTDTCGFTDAIGIAEYVQSRAIGCMLEPGSRELFSFPAGRNDPCDEEQLLFLNEKLPIYDILRLGDIPDESLNLSAAKRSPSEGPRFQIIRLGDSDLEISCPDVRAAF